MAGLSCNSQSVRLLHLDVAQQKVPQAVSCHDTFFMIPIRVDFLINLSKKRYLRGASGYTMLLTMPEQVQPYFLSMQEEARAYFWIHKLLYDAYGG